jgi:hypothetical protein
LTGSLTVTTTGTEFQVNAGGVNIGNALTDSHILSGSVRINPNGLFVSSSGNVGVGTISAVSKLTVDPGWVTNAGQWPSTAISIYNPTNIGAYSQISFGYTPSTTNSSAYIGYVSTNQGSNGYGDLVFGTRAVNTDTQPSERMRITSGGNFGFGTTSPSRQFVFSNGGAEGMEISASSGRVTIISYNRSTSSWLPLVLTEGSSNVLIGTTSDNGNKLQVSGGISASGQLITSAGQTGGYVAASSGYVNETQTVSTNGTSYYLYKSTGTSNGSSSTIFNITGMSTTNGTYADIYAVAQKDATGNAINTNLEVQINGQYMVGIQAGGTSATTVRNAFRVCRMDGSWIIIGTVRT